MNDVSAVDPIAAAEHRRRALLASLALMLTMVMWGLAVPLTKLLLDVFDPYLLAAARYIVALPILWLVVLWSGGRGDWRIVRPGRLAALGIAMTGFSILYTVGIAFSHPVTAAVLLMCGPIVASIMARFMFRTRLDRTLMVALPVTVAGGIVVALGAPGREHQGLGVGGGELLLVAAQVCWTWYSLKAQQWLSGLGQIRLSAVTTTAAAAWLILIYAALAALGLAALPPLDPPWIMVGTLVWVSLSGIALAILLWNFSASVIGVPLAALYMNLQPFVAALAAAALGSPPSLIQIVGGVVVLSGVLYVQVSKLRSLRAAENG